MALCQELSLSRPTVRQAIAELVSEGILVIVKGRGTFVADEPGAH
jgi:GntR family transcriptional regulator